MRPPAWRVVALIAGLASALPATPARADLPPARPPVADTLRSAGVRVSWPIAGLATLDAGERLVVRISQVRAPDATSRRARVSLIRVDGDGRAIRAVARRTLRAGRFSVRMPQRLGARYALRLAVADRRYWSWILVDRCPSRGSPSARLQLDPASGRIGDRLTVTLVNTGATCLLSGLGYAWERQLPDGTWQSVQARPPGYVVPAIGIITAPGATSTHGASVWPELTPGPHRLTKTIDRAAGTLTAPFTVLPEPGA